MKESLIQYLSCPACIPLEGELSPIFFDNEGNDIISGFLECHLCRKRYPIADGVAVLLRETHRAGAESVYEKPAAVSSYLWSHYSDLWGDPDSSNAYGHWAKLIGDSGGIALDAGCSVGRFTFEMGKCSRLSIGVDNSVAFVRKARELAARGRLKFMEPLEGEIEREIEIIIPDELAASCVEFIVADVTSLPFKRGVFNKVASLNIIDKVPLPLMHLKEMDRVANHEAAQFLFSDPFSWSEAHTPKEWWMGGVSEGLFRGYGIDNVKSVLVSRINEGLNPWLIEKEGDVWWKIKTHRNHFELIRSLFIKAVRP